MYFLEQRLLMSLCVSLTHISQTAPFTMRCCSRCADISSMTDKSMTKGTSLLWRNDLPQCHFNFLWIFDPIHQSIRFTNRIQCISVTIAGLPNTSPMIRFALLRPHRADAVGHQNPLGLCFHTHLEASSYKR